jgi:hypothetical protein
MSPEWTQDALFTRRKDDATVNKVGGTDGWNVIKVEWLKLLLNIAQLDIVWVETRGDDDKSYFHNMLTNECTLERPTDINARVMTKEQIIGQMNAFDIRQNQTADHPQDSIIDTNACIFSQIPFFNATTNDTSYY